MAIKIYYHLDNHGWADLHISNGPQPINIGISYLHDTLADFIGAANILLKGAPEAEVILMEEPAEYLVYLRAVDVATVTIAVSVFKEYKVIFSGEDTILSFSTQIFENARRLLTEYGMESYKAKWVNHDFPIAEYERLKRELERVLKKDR